MKKEIKIVAVCQDPGGLNAIYPVIERLRDSGSQVLLCASSYSADILRDKGIEFLPIPANNFSLAAEILDREKFDLLLTGTSFGFSAEDVFVEEARKRRIKSVAIFDSWVNFSVRFIDPSDKKHLRFLPDYICVSDDLVRKGMEREGIPLQRIVVTGNPYFDTLLKESEGFDPFYRDRFLANYGLSRRAKIITFFSQGLNRTFGNDSLPKGFLGYTQFDALQLLLSALKNKSACKDELILLIRPHPKEESAAYKEFESQEDGLRVMVSSKENPRDILFISEIIAGMFSILLIEAYILGKKILSIQPSVSSDTPFLLEKLNLLKPLRNSSEILEEMRRLELQDTFAQASLRDFLKIGNSTENILHLVYVIAGSPGNNYAVK